MVMRYFGMDTAERRPASVTPQGRATALTTYPEPALAAVLIMWMSGV